MRNTVWIEQGVRFNLNVEIKRKFQKLRAHCKKNKRDIQILSGNDSDHSMGSMHFSGDAFDMRHNGIPIKEMRKIFGPDYDIIRYGWGFHVEYDPKGTGIK